MQTIDPTSSTNFNIRASLETRRDNALNRSATVDIHEVESIKRTTKRPASPGGAKVTEILITTVTGETVVVRAFLARDAQ